MIHSKLSYHGPYVRCCTRGRHLRTSRDVGSPSLQATNTAGCPRNPPIPLCLRTVDPGPCNSSLMHDPDSKSNSPSPAYRPGAVWPRLASPHTTCPAVALAAETLQNGGPFNLASHCREAVYAEGVTEGQSGRKWV